MLKVFLEPDKSSVFTCYSNKTKKIFINPLEPSGYQVWHSKLLYATDALHLHGFLLISEQTAVIFLYSIDWFLWSRQSMFTAWNKLGL